MFDFFNFFNVARESNALNLATMFECTCTLCLCGLPSKALLNEGKISCSEFQLSARRKRKASTQAKTLNWDVGGLWYTLTLGKLVHPIS